MKFLGCYGRLLELKFTRNFKWNSYIRFIVKDGKIVVSLYCSRSCLISIVMLWLCKSHIRTTMEHCCDIWGKAAIPLISRHDRVPKHLHSLAGDELFLTLQPFSHLLLYHHFSGKCSDVQFPKFYQFMSLELRIVMPRTHVRIIFIPLVFYR